MLQNIFFSNKLFMGLKMFGKFSSFRGSGLGRRKVVRRSGGEREER